MFLLRDREPFELFIFRNIDRANATSSFYAMNTLGANYRGRLMGLSLE